MSSDSNKTFEATGAGQMTEEEILDDLVARGIARPIPKYETAGDECNLDGCDKPVPENDHKTMNLGLEDGYCSVGCLLEAEDQ